jgi:hypothetical protein
MGGRGVDPPWCLQMFSICVAGIAISSSQKLIPKVLAAGAGALGSKYRKADLSIPMFIESPDWLSKNRGNACGFARLLRSDSGKRTLEVVVDCPHGCD